MGKISRDARLLFILTWTLADDEGRLRGNSRMLASLLFPYDKDAPDLIDGWVAELIAEGCIYVYSVDGSTYMQIAKWLNHQKIDKPSKSKIPEFVESSRILANVRGGIKDQGSKDQGAEDRKETSCSEPQSVSQPEAPDLVDLVDMAELDEVLAGGTLATKPEPTPAVPPESPALMMPLAGTGEFGIMQTHIDEWVTAYPGVDVVRQLAAMRQWCIANPRKRKTRRGVLSFCNSWLMKEQDKAGARLGPDARASPQPSKFDPVAHVNRNRTRP